MVIIGIMLIRKNVKTVSTTTYDTISFTEGPCWSTSVVGGCALILAAFIMLAVFNYNSFYWLKISVTTIVIGLLCYKDSPGTFTYGWVYKFVLDIFLAGIIGTVVSVGVIGFLVYCGFYSSQEMSVKVEELTIFDKSDSSGGIQNETPVYVYSTGSEFVYRKGDDEEYVQKTVPSANTTVHYIKDGSTPRVVQYYQTTFCEWRTYGEINRHNEKTENFSNDIYIPEGSTVNLE